MGVQVGADLAAERRLDAEGQPLAEDPRGAVFALPGWYDVIYEPELQRSAVDKLLRFLGQLADQDEEMIKTGLLSLATVLLGTTACRLKHPAFQGEREVRYLAVKGLGNDYEFFRQGPRGVVPYLKLGAAASPTQVGQAATTC